MPRGAEWESNSRCRSIARPRRDKVVQPGHPDADAERRRLLSGIDLTNEFVNALEASRAYEANVATIDITKGMYSEALKIPGVMTQDVECKSKQMT